jgi:hypothetical protein
MSLGDIDENSAALKLGVVTSLIIIVAVCVMTRVAITLVNAMI